MNFDQGHEEPKTGLNYLFLESSELFAGVRGKYARRYQAGANLVLLSPDVAEHFPDELSVNMALRKLIHAAKVKKIS